MITKILYKIIIYFLYKIEMPEGAGEPMAIFLNLLCSLFKFK